MKIKILIYILFGIIIATLIKITIIDNKIYLKKLDEATNTYVYGNSPPRGRIYDRNHNLLVDNERVLEITYSNQGLNKIEELDLAYQVVNYIDLDYNKVTINNLKELYKVKNSNTISNKISKEEYAKLKERKLTNNDINNLIFERISDEELSTLNDLDRKVAYLYYLMNNGYSYSTKTIKKEATESEYAYFSLNSYRLNGFNTNITFKRIYPYGDLFKSILGNVGLIPKELKDEYLKKGYSLNDIVGLSNIELEYENELKGKKAIYKKISNNKLELVSEEVKGNDLVLSIDINLIKDINDIIDRRLIKAKSEPNTKYLNKTYVIIQEPNTGNILAMSGRKIDEVENGYYLSDITSYILTDPMTPGSVIKGASILVGYNTGAIKIGESFTDECIKFHNLPRKCSAQRYGMVDDIKALAVSSNVYQFKTALKVAGIDYHYNMDVTTNKDNFDVYRNTFKEFGLGVKTEIDLPIESIGNSSNKYTPDLYMNLVIGQLDTYTPIQLSQYITTISSNGNRLRPRLLKEIYSNLDNNTLLEKVKPTILNTVTTKEEYLNRVQAGFREVMVNGYGNNVMGKLTEPAGKTGTSESFLDTDDDGIIDTETVSSSFVGYAPYNNPKMTITVTTPDVSYKKAKTDYISYVNRLISRDISNMYFEKY